MRTERHRWGRRDAEAVDSTLGVEWNEDYIIPDLSR